MTVTLLPVILAERPSTKPYVALTALQVLDVATTYAILTWFAAGRSEGNPVVGAVFSSVGLAAGCLMLLVLKLAAVWLFYACQTKVRLANAVYGLVIFNNVLLLVLALVAVLL